MKKYNVKINIDHCKACKICVALCPKKILVSRHDGKTEVTDESQCIGCKMCHLHCPDFCFDITEVQND